MRDGMHPRARSGHRPVARGHGVFWLALGITSALLIGGCRSASTPADTQAPPPASTSPSASASTSSASAPASAPPAASSPVPEFGTLPPPPPAPDPTPPAGSVGTAEGWIDPAGSAPTSSTPAAGSQAAGAQASSAQTTTAQIPGYRVQIFASSERARAESAAADARQRFTEAVYIEFEAPLYKVRVGDCATRHEADALKVKAGTAGYDGAWVAETPVRSR